MLEITVNGEPQTAPPGQTILGLIRQLELDPARVAVELDRRIVKQPLWPETLWRRYGRPEVKEEKIQKRVGFHTFRHTYTTLLTQNT